MDSLDWKEIEITSRGKGRKGGATKQQDHLAAICSKFD